MTSVPEHAKTTISASSWVAIFFISSTSKVKPSCGLKSLARSSKRHLFDFAERPKISKSSEFSLTTARTCDPTDPVAPNMTSRFFIRIAYKGILI